MTGGDIALLAAGAIGAGVSIFHAIIMQRRIVTPIVRLAASGPMPAPVVRLIPPLLHVSSLSWLICGVALVTVALQPDSEARATVGVMAAVTYGFAALLNAWATRGRHPGWALMTIAVALILVGLSQSLRDL